ncbi:MAG TPA: hypothetical protein VF274_08335 [Alphaproteobacteria bacterium]
MPPKRNPLGLNKLQLRTLALLQELAALVGSPAEEPGSVTVAQFPPPHGDHFHLGEHVVRGSDATGLRIEAVWVALARKGLARSNFPASIVLTPAGLAYDTGVRDQVLHKAGH